MHFKLFILLCFFNGCLCNDNLRWKRQDRQRQRQSYGTTNSKINENVKRLEKAVRSLDSKLSRHEFREVQVADFSTKTLNALNADHTVQQKNMKAVAKQLGKLEERILALDSLIQTVDDRQRSILDNLSDGLNRLLMVRPDIPGADLLPLLPPGGAIDMQKLLKRVNSLDDNLNQKIKGIDNEVKIVGESLTQHMEQLTARHDRLWTDWTTCQNDQVRALAEATSSLSQTGSIFADQISEAKNLITSGGSAGNCDEINNELVERLNSLDKVYQDQEKQLVNLNQDTHHYLQEQGDELQKLVKLTETGQAGEQKSFKNLIGDLNALSEQNDHNMGLLEGTMKSVVEENQQKISATVKRFADVFKTNSEIVLNTLEDSASMSENLQFSLTENFEDLTRDIRGLKKVEQVMLSTADAVLDTKRSIEFGIQQIILELGDIVKDSGRTINSTLTDKINSISFAIVKNQTSALTNMTSKMENEISQVWRQIGIMYQQVAQSVDMLDTLQSTTSKQMNASLDKVGSMDGTVGAINNKVADVEDNLNYLLGRLSLVTSEFSQMKNGVGEELEKLREMAQEFSQGDMVEYKVNKKKRSMKGKHHRRT